MEGWEVIESRQLFKATNDKTVFIDLYQDKVRTPKGSIITYTRYQASDVVIVVPFLGKQRLLMIEQYRYPVGKVLLEFPAGHVDSGEDPIETAARELEEETGHVAKKIEYVYSYHPAVSRTKQLVHVFKATGLTRASAIKHDSGEQIKMKKLTIQQLRKLIAKRKVGNAGTLIAYMLCCTMIKINPGRRQ
jgi:ADP-ribose diphosphatase